VKAIKDLKATAVQAIQLVDLSARCSTPMLPFPISHNRQSGLREAKAEKLATVDLKDLEMVMKQAIKLTDFTAGVLHIILCFSSYDLASGKRTRRRTSHRLYVEYVEAETIERTGKCLAACPEPLWL
jgi:hypothetical protein